jgi:AcrR family transcriptional regulator
MATKPTLRLRERNKRRTRETIARVALELFGERGYEATTLVDVAEAAGVAPSTLHAYFPTKDALLFSVYDIVIESAREYLFEDRAQRSGIEAVLQWVGDELPAVLAQYGADALVTNYRLMHSTPEFRPHERSRDALLEDVFAAAFERDLHPPNPLRAQVLALIAHRAIMEVWEAWTRQYAGNSELALTELTDATVSHVRKLLEGSKKAVSSLPEPGRIECDAPRRRTRAPRGRQRRG